MAVDYQFMFRYPQIVGFPLFVRALGVLLRLDCSAFISVYFGGRIDITLKDLLETLFRRKMSFTS